MTEIPFSKIRMALSKVDKYLKQQNQKLKNRLMPDNRICRTIESRRNKWRKYLLKNRMQIMKATTEHRRKSQREKEIKMAAIWPHPRLTTKDITGYSKHIFNENTREKNSTWLRL
ncbi:hypothetical protein CEXT_771841 [Caerostris extrusa]|uniref:Uncharacterized protein n=1 Tax=Caerostris extrusa TaxID=172846 RepID=A0AAV4US10_CAEEX|nr:hypothetical protein CEXT_771841 [Caerostris extrusa]